MKTIIALISSAIVCFAGEMLQNGVLLHGVTFDRVNIENIVTFKDDKDCKYTGVARNQIAQGQVFVKLNKRVCGSEEKVITGFVAEDDVSGMSVEENFEGKFYYATLKPFKKIILIYK